MERYDCRTIVGRAPDQLTVADFLLFLPTHSAGLQAVLSYYNTTAKMNAEGDVSISDEALQGLGTAFRFLCTSLFGVVISLGTVRKASASNSTQRPSASSSNRQVIHIEADPRSPSTALSNDPTAAQLASDEDGFDDSLRDREDPHIPVKPARRKDLRLTDLVPHAGYFLAGAVAGITSRTATAPLDRLKVYLIAQTDDSREALNKAKEGNPVQATKQGARTLGNAIRSLWAAGGVRSLFAGE